MRLHVRVVSEMGDVIADGLCHAGEEQRWAFEALGRELDRADDLQVWDGLRYDAWGAYWLPADKKVA